MLISQCYKHFITIFLKLNLKTMFLKLKEYKKVERSKRGNAVFPRFPSSVYYIGK